jgi:hypothetical protein
MEASVVVASFNLSWTMVFDPGCWELWEVFMLRVELLTSSQR